MVDNSLLLEDIDSIDQSKDTTVFDDAPIKCGKCLEQHPYKEWKDGEYSCPKCGLQSSKAELDGIVKYNTALMEDSKKSYSGVDKKKDYYGYGGGYGGYYDDYGYSKSYSKPTSELSKYMSEKITYDMARLNLANLLLKRDHADIYSEMNKKAINMLTMFTDEELVILMNQCLREGITLLEAIDEVNKHEDEKEKLIREKDEKATEEAVDDLDLALDAVRDIKNDR